MAEQSAMKNAVGGTCGCVTCKGGTVPSFRVDKHKKGNKANKEANGANPKGRRGGGGR